MEEIPAVLRDAGRVSLSERQHPLDGPPLIENEHDYCQSRISTG